MNHTAQKYLLALLSCCFFSDAFAATSPALQIARYYQATCADYRGTWQGFITDPTDLFKNGGPWPITITLDEKNGQLFGTTQSSSPIRTTANLWAHCDNGELSQIFWGKRGDCGGFSEQGMLVSRNVLVLELHWENAMIDADLFAFLQRQSDTDSSFAPKPEDFNLGSVTSCH